MAVVLTRRRFTVEEYEQMGQAGILGEDERVELVEGEIVEMTPIGEDHASIVARLTHVLTLRLGEHAVVWPQNPLTLPRQVSQFQPDIALLKPRSDFYRRKRVEPDDTLLVVEVMDSSVRYDRQVKLPIYARAGVQEVWLVDVNRDTVDSYRAPARAGYRDHRVVGRDGTIAPLAFPDVVLPIAELIG
jgi:Uma2 family endonuclease